MVCIELLILMTLVAIAPYAAEAFISRFRCYFGIKLVRKHQFDALLRKILRIPQAKN